MTSPNVKTLLRTAAKIEHEAAKQYSHLAEIMDEHGNTDAASVFRLLAEEEVKHIASVSTPLQDDETAITGLPATDHTPESDIVGTWKKSGRGAQLITAYDAFNLAVNAEERAFAFFTEVAAKTDDPDLRFIAEQLAREELHHLAIVRLERRRERRRELEIQGMQTNATVQKDTDLRSVHESAAKLWSANRLQNHPSIDHLLGALENFEPSAIQSGGDNILQLLRDHLASIDHYCENLIENANGTDSDKSLSNEIDRWLSYLDQLQNTLDEFAKEMPSP